MPVLEAGASGIVRGNAVEWDGACWRLPSGEDAHGTALRCPQCGVWHLPDDPDACLRTIEGVAGACCGHGVHLGYVNWDGIGVGPEWQAQAFVGVPK
ncbi:MAG: hypothetical protein AB7I38_11000 [Dehalococcoidia bacterium]